MSRTKRIYNGRRWQQLEKWTYHPYKQWAKHCTWGSKPCFCWETYYFAEQKRVRQRAERKLISDEINLAKDLNNNYEMTEWSELDEPDIVQEKSRSNKKRQRHGHSVSNGHGAAN